MITLKKPSFGGLKGVDLLRVVLTINVEPREDRTAGGREFPRAAGGNARLCSPTDEGT